MTIISSNLLTSYYVESALKVISKSFSERFDSLEGMPIMYYDWAAGYSDVFKQYFAKIPYNEYRDRPWFTIAYSYGKPVPNSIQSRAIPEVYVPIYSGGGISTALKLNTRLTSIDVLCSILTNDGNYANSLANFRMHAQSYWKNIKCADIFYPQWKLNTKYPENFVVIPRVPNGFIYIAENAGQSGSIKINWSTTVGDTIKDGDITWRCSTPREAKIELHNFVLPDIKTSNVYNEGIRYIVEFAFTLSFVGLEDASYILSTIKGFDNHLYKVVSNAIK